MTQVHSSRRFDRNQPPLLLALSGFADDADGNVFPSVKKMAEKTLASTRTVQRNLLQLLENEVLIEVQIVTLNFPAEYPIILAKLQESPSDEGRHSHTPEDEERHGDGQTVKRIHQRAGVNWRVFEREFEDWYQHYSSKVSRGAAEWAFAAARHSSVSLETPIKKGRSATQRRCAGRKAAASRIRRCG